MREVRTRFSDVRWTSFVDDHTTYMQGLYRGAWARIRRDHGYNPSPTWTAVAQIFSSRVPANATSLGLLGSLDAFLLIALFIVVYRTYGYKITCIAITIAGLAYGWHHMYIGTFLRLD